MNAAKYNLFKYNYGNLLNPGTARRATWANDLISVWGSSANADSNTNTGRNICSIRWGSISARRVYGATSSTNTESIPRAPPSINMNTVYGKLVPFTKLLVKAVIKFVDSLTC